MIIRQSLLSDHSHNYMFSDRLVILVICGHYSEAFALPTKFLQSWVANECAKFLPEVFLWGRSCYWGLESFMGRVGIYVVKLWNPQEHTRMEKLQDKAFRALWLSCEKAVCYHLYSFDSFPTVLMWCIVCGHQSCCFCKQPENWWVMFVLIGGLQYISELIISLWATLSL